MSRPWVSPLDRMVTKLVYAQRTPVIGKVASWVLRLLGIQIPPQVEIGPGLRLPHSTTGVVVHPSTRIGRDVILFHNVTIGRRDAYDMRPQFVGTEIEDGAVICVGAVVLGNGRTPLTVGAGSVVGANAVLLESTRPGEMWAGNPARVVRRAVGG